MVVHVLSLIHSEQLTFQLAPNARRCQKHLNNLKTVMFAADDGIELSLNISMLLGTYTQCISVSHFHTVHLYIT